MAIGKTNAGGGGSSGATLTITGVAGATVTASKNGKTYTRTINNSGTAVFKGLSTGVWTVTMSGGGQSTTRTVEITADYSLTIAYFSATITITYPANSTCVVTDSSGATIASDTNTGTSAKTWTATVGATGTYTITATATDGSGKTKTTIVSITTNGQSETVALMFELVLFDNGLVDGIAWDYVYNQDTDASSSISDVIKMHSRSWDNGIVLQRPIAERGISSAIDLSNYSILKIRTKACTNSDGDAELRIGSSLSGKDLGTVSIEKTAGQTTIIDVSAIAKSSFVTIWARSGNEYGYTIDISFDKVWLE